MHNWVDDPIFIYFFLIIMNKIIPYGFHVEFGHSITIPYGIQVEWRSQNEWDLSQNIFHMKWWIPYEFHME